MLQPNPSRTAARAQTRTDRLAGQACALCGIADPVVLDRKEGHHVANRTNEPNLTVPLCANCHRIQTEALQAAGVPNRYPDGGNALDRLSAILAGVGIFLAHVAVVLTECARWVDELHRRLREDYPDLETLLPAWTSFPNGGVR